MSDNMNTNTENDNIETEVEQQDSTPVVALSEEEARKLAMEENKAMLRSKRIKEGIVIAALVIASLLFIYPIVMIFINSLKEGSAFSTKNAFKLPTKETFVGLENYVDAVKSKGFLESLAYSLIITVTSVGVILLCCSMCAYYITRIRNKITEALYYVFVFSMVVPFQMVMYTLSTTANRIHLDTPYTIWIVYLGFGAGLAVFMFCGFMKSIPVEIEEAAMIDGCNPLQTFFMIVIPMLKPTLISVAILEAMWVWNDYLLPSLVLDVKKYKTIPMLIQYFRGSYGKVEWGPLMACMMLTIIPIVIIYIAGQKYIIKGVAAGAVKG